MVPWARELHALQLLGLLFEDLDELIADDLPLCLRIGHALELGEEPVHGVHVDQVGVHLILEHLHHLLGLALAQQAVVSRGRNTSCLPMALMSRAATTEESTPPDKASRTILVPPPGGGLLPPALR